MQEGGGNFEQMYPGGHGLLGTSSQKGAQDTISGTVSQAPLDRQRQSVIQARAECWGWNRRHRIATELSQQSCHTPILLRPKRRETDKVDVTPA